MRTATAKIIVAVLLVGAAVALTVSAPRATAPRPRDPGTRLRLLPPGPLAFARATAPRAFRLPLDHGPHFEFQTEWWYYTGNLDTAEGRRFGFQLTVFRRGLSPGPPAAEGLATNQIYFAHLAVTDVAAGRHESAERFSRGAAGLAGARALPFRVWVEDWSVDAAPGSDGSTVRVAARHGDLVVDLELQARKPLVAHGDRGLSAKSDEPGNASYYASYTRMTARGRIGADGGEGVSVTGQAWFDHEWSTSALGPRSVGWDWFSLQTDDGRELMFFEIRREDGSAEPASGGTLVEKDGRPRRLAPGEVRIDVLERWTSPHSAASYPVRWRLDVPSEDLTLEIEARLPDQEMRTFFVYWEGTVGLRGASRGQPVEGQGYVEMTGYARSMQGVF